MTKLIRTNSSSKKTRNARKPNPATQNALSKQFQDLTDKWASVPKFAGKYGTATASGKKRKLPTPPTPVSPVVTSPVLRTTGQQPVKAKYTTDVGALPHKNTYTGTEVKGIAVMHKSCLQPIFTDEQAKDSAKMRRG